MCQAELRHFVYALNNYVMTRVVQTIWEEHKQRIASAKSVSEVAAIHGEYLDTVLRCCLLSTDATPTKVLVFLLDILSLVDDFSIIYKEYLTSIGMCSPILNVIY